MTTTAEDKLRIIEEILATDDADVLREIKLLLNRSAFSNSDVKPMSIVAFNEKFDRAEQAIRQGDVMTSDDVRVQAKSWAKK